MATKKSSSTGKGGKQTPREPGFFSDYGGTGITNVRRPGSSTPVKKSSGGKKK